jgi:hypothetical protein
MAIEEKELYFAHSLDVAWIIALWHWIHGGDPAANPQSADTTELIARGLVGHLSGTKPEVPKNIIEKLAKLGINVTVKSKNQHTQIKSTAELHAVSKQHGGLLPMYCITLADGAEFCWRGRFVSEFFMREKAA